MVTGNTELQPQLDPTERPRSRKRWGIALGIIGAAIGIGFPIYNSLSDGGSTAESEALVAAGKFQQQVQLENIKVLQAYNGWSLCVEPCLNETESLLNSLQDYELVVSEAIQGIESLSDGFPAEASKLMNKVVEYMKLELEGTRLHITALTEDDSDKFAAGDQKYAQAQQKQSEILDELQRLLSENK